MTKNKWSKFTLLELLIVIALVGILLSILLPSLQNARHKAMVTVCNSNLNQIGKANHLYLAENNQSFYKTSTNTAYTYFGSGGNGVEVRVGTNRNTVTQRPLNKYLGYTDDSQTVTVGICPLNSGGAPKFDYLPAYGTSYHVSARNSGSFRNDLDGDNSLNTPAMKLAKVNDSSVMVFASSSGTWHTAYYGKDNNYSSDNHGKSMFTLNFVDGHNSIKKIIQGTGMSHSRDEIDFSNAN